MKRERKRPLFPDSPGKFVTMGNAATCEACGSDRALKTSGSNSSLDQHADYYGCAESGSDVDDSLVRRRRRGRRDSAAVIMTFVV